VAERDGALAKVDIVQGTLAKAFGVVGGYITGSAVLIDAVRSYAPGFIFTSTMPPPVAAAARAAVRHLKSSSRERVQQQEQVAATKRRLASFGLPVMPSETHIVPLLIGCPVKAKRISDILLAEYGLYVQPINFPTVPRGTERLRFTPGPQHSADMMDELTGALVEIFGRDDIRIAA
jgi:5-aminolevulinate synthase